MYIFSICSHTHTFIFHCKRPSFCVYQIRYFDFVLLHETNKNCIKFKTKAVHLIEIIIKKNTTFSSLSKNIVESGPVF